METEGTTGLFILMRQSEGQEETTESTQKANNLHKLT